MKPVTSFIVGLLLCLGSVGCIHSEIPVQAFETAPTPTVHVNQTDLFAVATPEVIPSHTPYPTNTTTPTPLPTNAQSKECMSLRGHLEIKQLKSDRLSTNLVYRLYSPPCYEHNQDQYYPVLYLLHGYGYNDDQWSRLGVIDITNSLVSAGEIPPLIIVMPFEPDPITQPPENRFGEALLFELAQAVDTEYRTIPSSQYRAIGGLSRGGNWAIHIGLTNWDFFGLIGVHSAPLFISDGLPQIREWLEKIPPASQPQVFLDIGDRDKWLQNIIGLEETLDDYNIPHEFYMFPGEHTEDYWSSHLEQYIRWYTRNW